MGDPRIFLELTSLVPEPATGFTFALGGVACLLGVRRDRTKRGLRDRIGIRTA